MEVIEPAPDPPLTFDRVCNIARENGHSLFFGRRYEIDIDYAVGCRNCGALSSWVDEDTKDELNPRSIFLKVYNKPCSAVGGRV